MYIELSAKSGKRLAVNVTEILAVYVARPEFSVEEHRGMVKRARDELSLPFPLGEEGFAKLVDFFFFETQMEILVVVRPETVAALFPNQGNVLEWQTKDPEDSVFYAHKATPWPETVRAYLDEVIFEGGYWLRDVCANLEGE